MIDVPGSGPMNYLPPRREAEDVFGVVIQALEAAKLIPAEVVWGFLVLVVVVVIHVHGKLTLEGKKI